MKKYIVSFFILLIIAAAAFSFRNTGGKYGPHLTALLDNTTEKSFTVYVYLADKGPGANAKLSNPLSLVTQKSLDRRLKVKSPENIVDFSDIPIYQGYADVISQNVLKVRQQIKWFNAVTVEVTKEQLEALAGYSFVSQIELVERYYKKHENVENNESSNPVINKEPVKDNIESDSLSYGTGLTQVSQIHVNLVHDESIFGQGVLIASFDVGWANQTHEAFTTLPMKVVSQYDFEQHRPTAGDISATSEYWHGTETLSNIGGYMPGKLISPSFKSSFIVARTEVDSFERPIEMDNWIAASQWADSLGADVISSSLGYLVFDSPYGGYTWSDMNGHTMPISIAAALAADHGIVVCNSAGNDGPNSSHNTLGGPADADSIVTVGAVTSTGTITSFSSVGPTTDNPPRIKPDVLAMGQNNYVATTGSNSAYTHHDGTSYSCPLTAGVVGLVLSANKNLTPIQVRGILRKFASNSASPNNTYGWGIIDAFQSVDSARKLDNAAPTILHTQPFTQTVNTGIITMNARIFDNGIIRLWNNQAPMIYFRKSTNGGGTWGAYTSVTANTVSADTFSFQITGSALGTTVEYYFAAQDIALPNPLMTTLPAGGSGINPPGTTAPPTRFSFYVGVVGISQISGEIPEVFKLYNNYPNPFNPSTKIKFDIAKQSFTKIRIYDLTGREVAVLVNQDMMPGKYEINFNASQYASGVYFYKIETPSYTNIKKMILVK